ncbi:gas vesicle protein GvpL [Halobacillus litoralis]|uniref:Gas vesicle protein GvpL n=1 Tax=Halobacillus litoralis TaxID=45668 RepID=A0A845DUX3_9BACI|nr:GvpL/GvpF family gas vesicle protein [Halobacillus litoralis]MYL20908.1 gas vesicle protein GvpL [Halobacillus litoralis]
MGELFYLYGVTWKEEAQEAGVTQWKGVDGSHPLFYIELGNLAAVVSFVDESEFGEEVLKEKTNEMEWLKKKAFRHHEVLMQLNDGMTLIPMKFATIFKKEENIQHKASVYETEWETLLQQLLGTEEWNVKVYNRSDLLKEHTASRHPEVMKRKEDIAQMSKGMQYLQTKKLDSFIEEMVSQEQETYARNLHRRFKEFCVDTTSKKVWNKNVTGKDEEMCWNGAYLLKKDQVEAFLEQITTAQEDGREAGWMIEVTGPWPPYHFSDTKTVSGVQG